MTHLIKNKKQSGYAVLELLFYIGFFFLLSLVTINAMITMAQSFKETDIHAGLARSGAIMERITREIRQADSISAINSNSIKLSATDDEENVRTAEFQLSGSNVRFLENDVFIGNLNTPDVTVTGLVFTEITTAEGRGVKIVLTVRAASDIQERQVNFYDTVILRGSY